jgi:cytochrome P450
VRFGRRPLDLLRRWRARYGDVFTVKMAGFGTGVYVVDPHARKPVRTAATCCRRGFVRGNRATPQRAGHRGALGRIVAADEFRPERFVEDGAESYSWLPFGGGIRRCIGAALAHAEMAEVLRVVVPRVELKRLSDQPDPVVLRGITLAPKHGVRVAVGRRSTTPRKVVIAAAR